MTCPSNVPRDCGVDVPTTLSDDSTLLINDVPHHWDAARDGWVGPDGSVFTAATLLSLVGAPVGGTP